MNAAVLYWERNPGVFSEDFVHLEKIVRFLRVYGYTCDVLINQEPKRGVRYDVGVVISAEDVSLRSALFFRFLKLEAGIPAAIRKVLDEKVPFARAQFKLFGFTSSEADALLESVPKESGVSVYHQTERLDTIVSVRAEHRESLEPFIKGLYERAGDHLYSDCDESLAECALRLLRFHKKKLSVAESLTGGLITDTLVQIPGASLCLMEGAVTYANEAKQKRLGVSEDTLRKFGAVSEQTAFEMCRGLLETGWSDYAVSTTGIAGPGGGTAQKPVGTVFIGVGNRENITVYKHCFPGKRDQVRRLSCSYALYYLIGKIKNKMDGSSYRVK